MKFTFVIALISISNAVKVQETAAKEKSTEELMNEILGGTVFSRDHNLPEDRAFLTGVFHKYSMLGNDASDEINGKRVLTEFNSKWAARDILREWKGLNGEDLDNFIDSDNYSKIFKEFDYANNNTID